VKQWKDHGMLAPRTGMIIPAYFSPKPDDDTVRQLLWMTLADTPYFYRPEQTLVVVDGDQRTARLAREAQERMLDGAESTFGLLELPENRGKFGAMAAGISQMIAEQPKLD